MVLYSDSQKFILQLLFLKLHLVLKTDHVFELFLVFKIIMLRVMFSRQILFSVFIMVSHADIWNPFRMCGIYMQRIPHIFFPVIFPLFPQCCTAAQLSVCRPNRPEWRMERFEWRLCKWGPIDKVRPREICGIILRHVCLFSQVGTCSTLGWSEKCHTVIHSLKKNIFHQHAS